MHCEYGTRERVMNLVQERMYKRRANQIARRFGFQKATKIVLGNEDTIVERIPPGYRKHTTGEYVRKAYRNRFGWKKHILSTR